ncbi:prepilin-type N-terminal cleavage/methylation domain-containing protein [Euhalothece natronophila Z-M001]|uniref:Prepilin-type N-terminal cleavage/methylation domain-containing protein n=1 Tax=Euhalothece natronophila Z-M001 TaxID=522448 RepID=A0A5B8NU06_9CHRO|nr:type II secretion system protein [Euhalothece natronophila]QDZ41530.1 prepilin-type N-terminal cleavage/methylation domain-containing protein [Euhalothece natronophila Z-M001]
MKFKLLYLTGISHSQQNKGLTIIELLVVIIMMSIISALAWPIYLSQAGRARESAARSLIGKVNRSQQAYRLVNGTFTEDYSQLEDFETLPDPDGYSFAETMEVTNDQAIVEVESNDTASQPHLCGIATFTSTEIQENSTFGNGNCP